MDMVARNTIKTSLIETFNCYECETFRLIRGVTQDDKSKNGRLHELYSWYGYYGTHTWKVTYHGGLLGLLNCCVEKVEIGQKLRIYHADRIKARCIKPVQ
jgi:hypothetical protein